MGALNTFSPVTVAVSVAVSTEVNVFKAPWIALDRFDESEDSVTTVPFTPRSASKV